jgi:Protein of unknown function (DUF3800)
VTYTPFFHFSVFNRPTGSHLMGVLLKGYLDDSGKENDPQHEHVCYAGYVAPDTAWASFEKEWAAVLADSGAKYLHMNEFAHSREIFKEWKGDEPRRKRFLKRLIKVIRDHDLKPVATVVNIKAVQKLNETFGLSLRAEPLALYFCMFHAENLFNDSPIEFRLDKGDKVFRTIERMREIAISEMRVDMLGSNYDVHPIPNHESFKTILPIQAADLLAYESLKFNRYRSTPDHVWTQRKPFKALLVKNKNAGMYMNYKGLLNFHEFRKGAWPGTKEGRRAVSLREFSTFLRKNTAGG